ncbi:MAG: glycoside hydrolase, partial [Acidobacteria bacterium]|nr:glycoside hydrolase [Acidobacteriota bacterium]
MKNSKSPAASNARRRARRAASLIFTLALVLAGLAPRGSEVEAKSRAKSHGRARVAAAANAKSRVAKRSAKAAREDREESERYDVPGDGEEGEGDNFEKREEWFRFQRAYPFADIPADARRQAWESRPRGGGVGGGGGGTKEGDLRGVLSVNASAWTPLGPLPTTPKFQNNWGKTSGRINAIAVKPDDANVVLVGASTGGVWRSTDGGANFAPASDAQVDLSVASIAFALSNPSIVYAGMGDIGNSYLGTGVLKSTDGGATWTRVSRVLGTDCATLPAFGAAGCLPAPGIAMAVAVDPNDPNRVYLAEYLYSTGGFSDPGPANTFSAAGFYISTDGGVNWTKTLSGLPRDIAIKPGDPQTIYAAMRRVDTNVDGVNSPGIYKSTNAGQTWARIYETPYTDTGGNKVLRD